LLFWDVVPYWLVVWFHPQASNIPRRMPEQVDAWIYIEAVTGDWLTVSDYVGHEEGPKNPIGPP